jgi:hypothetical protein
MKRQNPALEDAGFRLGVMLSMLVRVCRRLQGRIGRPSRVRSS